MRALDFWSAPYVFVEIGVSSLRVINSERGAEFQLVRLDNGRLTPACKTALRTGLKEFVGVKAWQKRPQAICAVGARGASLRRLRVPPASREDLPRVLELQLESEFPVPPDALAWGYCSPRNGHPSTSGNEVFVGAVKRDAIEEYARLFEECGLQATFTLAAAVRPVICPHPLPRYQILEVGRHLSELSSVENETTTSVRVLPWGILEILREVSRELGVTLENAELQLEAHLKNPSSNLAACEKIDAIVRTATESIAQMVRQTSLTEKIYLMGDLASCPPLGSALARALKPKVEVERLDFPTENGCSTATLALKQLWERKAALPELTLQFKDEAAKASAPIPEHQRWLALAGLLLVLAVCLRYAEPFLFYGRLSRKLAELKSYRETLPRIDRELGFLQFIDSNFPPALDTLFVIANAAPPGTRVESFGMSRRGEISLRGAMQNPQQTTEFRTKLNDTGYFQSVTLDEQAPTPDRQRVTFRLSAQLKPNGQRPTAVTQPTSDTKALVPPSGSPGPAHPLTASEVKPPKRL